MAVVGIAVQLDDEALLWPERVDLTAEESRIHGGQWKPVLPAQRSEQILEWRACGSDPLLGYEFADCRQARSPSVPITGLFKGVGAEKAEAIRLLEGTGEPLSRNLCSDIDERPCHARDRDSVAHRYRRSVKTNSVQANARPSASAVR